MTSFSKLSTSEYDMETTKYDFVIIGGGTSGSVLANRLASSPTSPTVLLIEAGGSNDNPSLRDPSARAILPFTQPTMHYDYNSIPQTQLAGQQLALHQGRGLGGSSALNFCTWLLGHQEDYNEWARLVDDKCWLWDGEGGVKERFRKIENVGGEVGEEWSKYVGANEMKGHSREGKVGLGYNESWSDADTLTLEAGIEFNASVLGLFCVKTNGRQGPLNPDLGSGNSLGFGMTLSNFRNGLRSTAATSYLSSPPPNLTILLETTIDKILFNEAKTATGVLTAAGETYLATKEVVLSAGAFNSPAILLRSGIGPRSDLEKLSIPILHDLPSVGKNLKDHCLTTTTLLHTPRQNLGFNHGTTGIQVPMAFLSSPIVKSSPEFLSLPETTQSFLEKVPTYEFATTPFPLAGIMPERENAEIISFLTVVLNAQSTGTVTISSPNPKDDPVVDPNYLSHPYDQRVAIEGLRALIAFSNVSAFQKHTEARIEGPDGDEDDALLEHAKRSVQPVWHFGGTCRMGKVGDEESWVVDREFRVRGVQGLRVVDLSVMPLMTNNHTQSTAYLVGETAAEKIMEEYSL